MLRLISAALIVATSVFAGQTVEGRVVNSVAGSGIPGVRVTLEKDSQGAAAEQLVTETTPEARLARAQAMATLARERLGNSATTDSEGRFRIKVAKDGVYTATYRARGFWTIPQATNPSLPVAVAAIGNPVRLEIKMHPIGKLSGRVLDAAGKPVPDAGVWARSGSSWCKLPACVSSVVTAETNAKGEYSIADLPFPGLWSVSATAPTSWPPPESRDDRPLGWAHTFYPGVTDSESAAEISVEPGSEHSNVVVKLAALPVRRVRGRVLDVGGGPLSKARVTLGRNFGPILQQDTSDDGTFAFEFAPALDHEWHLSAKLRRNGVDLWAAHGVEISGRDSKEIELRLAAPFSVRGKIVVDSAEGVPAPNAARISAIYVGAGQADATRPGTAMFATASGGGGEFTLRNVYPGTYFLRPLDTPTPFYLDTIRLGDTDVAGAEAQILSGAQPLVVTYKRDGGTVRGAVEACANGDVFLVPGDPARRRGLIRRVRCGEKDRFEFPGVRPGEYYVYAVSGDRPEQSQYEETIRDLTQATRVTVRANQSTLADVRPIRR